MGLNRIAKIKRSLSRLIFSSYALLRICVTEGFQNLKLIGNCLSIPTTLYVSHFERELS
jgi:hypothetical protein